MSVIGGADYRPINYAGVPRMQRYDIACLHTIVGNDPAPAAHLSIRGDGWLTQSRDTAYQSAANYEGNPRVIAIETDDHGPEFGTWDVNDGHAVPAWTKAQMSTIAVALVWIYHTHGIPLVLAPNSQPGSRGIAYHRQGCDGNFTGYAYGGRVPGGELWSKARGKVCPGDRRIKQLIEIVIPMARQLAGLEGAKIVSAAENWTIALNGTNAVGENVTLSAQQWLTLANAYAGGSLLRLDQRVIPTLNALGEGVARLISMHGGGDAADVAGMWAEVQKSAFDGAEKGSREAVTGTVMPYLEQAMAALNEDDFEQARDGARAALAGLRDALPTD